MTWLLTPFLDCICHRKWFVFLHTIENNDITWLRSKDLKIYTRCITMNPHEKHQHNANRWNKKNTEIDMFFCIHNWFDVYICSAAFRFYSSSLLSFQLFSVYFCVIVSHFMNGKQENVFNIMPDCYQIVVADLICFFFFLSCSIWDCFIL